MSAVCCIRAVREAAAVLLLAAACAQVPVLAADPPGRPPVAEPDSRKEVQIMSLKNARAAEMAQVLKDVFGNGVTFGIDDRTNAIIVAGPVMKLAEVRVVLEKMDQASKDSAADRPLRSPRI